MLPFNISSNVKLLFVSSTVSILSSSITLLSKKSLLIVVSIDDKIGCGSSTTSTGVIVWLEVDTLLSLETSTLLFISQVIFSLLLLPILSHITDVV